MPDFGNGLCAWINDATDIATYVGGTKAIGARWH